MVFELPVRWHATGERAFEARVKSRAADVRFDVNNGRASWRVRDGETLIDEGSCATIVKAKSAAEVVLRRKNDR